MQEVSTTKKKKKIPSVGGRLRHNILELPHIIRKASGILVFGRRIKSFVFSTDIAIIRNCDADAVFAVYPFTPQQAISDAIIRSSFTPVFCGVGGSLTNGQRSMDLAKDVESQGAMGVVLNGAITNEDLHTVSESVDIPVVVTVVDAQTDISARLEAGAAILNVACAKRTAAVVRLIRERFPNVPIIASGGNREETIRETIEAGANAITYTPPSTAELFTLTMNQNYRNGTKNLRDNHGHMRMVIDAGVPNSSSDVEL